MLEFILLAIVAIALTVFVIVYINRKLVPLTYQEKDIPTFTTDFTFDEFPSNINIENLYDCNVNTLRECKMDDPTTVFGCKEMTAKCHHFDKDVKTEVGGETFTIPKNTDPNVGYALVLDHITDDCNPYHGDLVIVTTNPESNEYAMICECKNPGFIGNDTIMGNCTGVKICNGNIDDINQTIDKINCKCSSEKEISTRISDDQAPYCREMLINEANDKYKDWSHLVDFGDRNTISKDIYSLDIADNVNSSILIDPCANDFLSLKPIEFGVNNANVNKDPGGCTYRMSECIPLTGKHNLDQLRLLGKRTDTIHGVLRGETSSVALISNIDGVRTSTLHSGIWPSLSKYVLPEIKSDENNVLRVLSGEPAEIHVNAIVGSTKHGPEYNMKSDCEGDWPTWSCYFKLKPSTRNDCGGVPSAAWRNHPGSFLFGADDWDLTEAQFTDPGFSCHVKTDADDVPMVINYSKYWAITNFANTEKTPVGMNFQYRHWKTEYNNFVKDYHGYSYAVYFPEFKYIDYPVDDWSLTRFPIATLNKKDFNMIKSAVTG